MSLEERLEKAEKLVAEVKAELAAMRATKRNWPERIEAGMCFRWGKGLTYIYVQGGTLANIESGETFDAHLGFNGRERDFTYLGHARDILAIRTAAHEPTGAVVVAEPTPDEWREIAAKAISADLVDFLSGAAAYGRWLRGKIPQAIPADRVMADGMVGVDREAIKTAIGLVRCLVVGPGSGQAALSAMESALRSAKGETTP